MGGSIFYKFFTQFMIDNVIEIVENIQKVRNLIKKFLRFVNFDVYLNCTWILDSKASRYQWPFSIIPSKTT